VTIMMTTTDKNRAHREDTLWIKVGPSEYMRSDGATIRKDIDRAVWRVVSPSGRAGVGWSSLTVAKRRASGI